MQENFYKSNCIFVSIIATLQYSMNPKKISRFYKCKNCKGEKSITQIIDFVNFHARKFLQK